jgi:tripartite-type tricarboxylate transporter receptor subunit TctC
MQVNKVWCWAWIAGLLIAATPAREATAQSEPYPSRPVRLISDSAPGSSPDVGLRIVAEGLSQHWGQQVVVVNHPGASGAISARVAAEAAPDGYTLYAPALSTFLTLPGRAPNLPLMLPRDFIPIGFTFDQPMSIGASPTLGVNTLPELIALAKTKPGAISYSVAGVGRMTHLTGELLQIRADIKLQMVPYTGGAAQALSDIIAGRISMIVEGYAGMAGIYQAGSLKALAVGSAQRLPGVPHIPTFAETLPGFVAAGWQVVVAPKGTSETIINKVTADLRQVLSKPDMVSRLEARGSFPRPRTPAETEVFVREQQQLWKPAMERIASQTQ